MPPASDVAASSPDSGEGRGAFGGFIGPKTLLGLVKSTAPYLFDGSAPAFRKAPKAEGERLGDAAAGPLGWWAVVHRADRLGELVATPEPTAAQWTDYLAFCVAAHFSSVATYVPTDVDTKIRDRLWFTPRPPDELARSRDFVLGLKQWDMRSNSARYVVVDGEIVSGHDGERLSILAGGLLGLTVAGDAEGAAQFAEEIDAELRREAAAFDRAASEPGRERDLLVLSAILSHNAGDVDQGLSARGGSAVGEKEKAAFGRLAHERFERYGGAFGRACLLYRECISAEGHRNYPLREARGLRKDPDLLLPIGPFFDAWGATVARHPRLTPDERAEVVACLVEGMRRVRGQSGYQRALAGFQEAFPGGLDARDIEARLPAAVRRDLKDAALRRQIALRKESFESTLAKKARSLVPVRSG